MPSRNGHLPICQHKGIELRVPAISEMQLHRIAVGTAMALELCSDTFGHTEISIVTRSVVKAKIALKKDIDADQGTVFGEDV
jgi:hypothetical protein